MNAHDDNDPMELVAQLDATMEAVAATCPTCGTPPTVMPASGTRYVLGIDHDPGCPEHIADEDLPVAVVQPGTTRGR